MKSKIFAFVRVGISAGLLGLLFWLMRDNFKGILSTLAASNPLFIAGGICLFVMNTSVMACRMKIVFNGENLKLSLRDSIQLVFIGYFFNNFLPTAVGGDVMKAHYATYTNQQRMKSYASVLMDRLIGLYSFLIIAAVALIVNWGEFQMPIVKRMVFLFLFMGFVGFLIITNKKIADLLNSFFRRIKMLGLGERLESLYAIVHDYRNRLDIIAKSILVSAFAQSIYFVVIFIFFLSLGQRVAIGNIFLIMPVVTFISMLPSLGGIGLREGAIVALFAPVTGREDAFTVSMLVLFGYFALSFIGGIVCLWWGLSRKQKEKAI